MAAETCAPRPLFGGAISTTFPVPSGSSDIRQVPDHQEVFVDPARDESLIFELLDLKGEVDDTGSALWFLRDIAKRAGRWPCYLCSSSNSSVVEHSGTLELYLVCASEKALLWLELQLGSCFWINFRDNCRIDKTYFMCQQDSIKKVANMLERVQGLSLKDRYNFCFAPVNIRDPKAMYHLLRFATHYSQSRRVSIAMGVPRGSAKNDTELLDLETKHQVLSMYLWLSHHFEEDNFPHVQKAEEMATNIADLLGKSLAKVCWKPESRQQVRQRQQNGDKDKIDGEHTSSDGADGSRDGFERPRSLAKTFLR
ncbi:hypothetical protein PR202_ga20077 [Eleusine coracana subsp. coracana]|uniref:RNA helicase n=1 Tax=Eleusine coracana subsp. coracana TaxID=191504 RepID=A0AAV5CVQ0_ELECO|nr:hypothetical protein PR202_ga20077 [Eleusine coracana subsp. coracana]